MKIDARRLSKAIAERESKIDNLPAVDFIEVFVRELNEACCSHIPRIDEPAVRHGGYYGPKCIDLYYCRPNIGRGRDVAWRIIIDSRTARIQLVSGDFDRRVIKYIGNVIRTQLSALIASCVAARAAYSDFAVSINGFSLPVDNLRKVIVDSLDVEFEGQVFNFVAEIATELSDSDIVDVHSWVVGAIDSIAPICYAISPPISLLVTGLDKTEEIAYPEGAAYFRIHQERERDPKVVQEAKNQFKKTHQDRLFCEICGFDFFSRYGERGRDFAEAHHIRPVSAMKPGDVTRIEDLCIVCSNCHTMLHRSPLIHPKELKEIVRLHQGCAEEG